jgi:hypothetical protein
MNQDQQIQFHVLRNKKRHVALDKKISEYYSVFTLIRNLNHITNTKRNENQSHIFR